MLRKPGSRVNPSKRRSAAVRREMQPDRAEGGAMVPGRAVRSMAARCAAVP